MNKTSPRVITIGETMLMFAPPPNELMEMSDTYISLIGGAEANVAVGLQRLGIPSAWIGKLPANALGRKIANGIRALGVDVSSVIWTDTGRVGTFFVEWGAQPRPTRTIYDRENSVATTLKSWEINWKMVEQAEWLHMTGITPALSTTCRISTLEIIKRAREHDLKISFDLNYRSLLWQPNEAREAWQEILPDVNVIITTEIDAAILCARELTQKDYLRTIYNEYKPEAVVMTCGENGSMAFDGQHLLIMSTWPVEVVNRLGAGDAFAAGLIYGLMKANLHKALAYGNAMAVLKMTIPQNMPLVELDDVERLIRGSADQLMR